MEMENSTVLWILGVLLVCSMFLTGFLVGGVDTGATNAEVKAIVDKALADQPDPVSPSVPTAEEIAALVVIPDVESADNALLNEFLEVEFEDEFDEIENEAEAHAWDELSDHDFRLVENHLKTLLAEGEELDEDSITIGGEDLEDVEIEDLEDFDVKVTALGLEEDEDKSAIVTFELEVEYELEEGVRDTFEEDMIVTFSVVYDEGVFRDELVELVSIV